MDGSWESFRFGSITPILKTVQRTKLYTGNKYFYSSGQGFRWNISRTNPNFHFFMRKTNDKSWKQIYCKSRKCRTSMTTARPKKYSKYFFSKELYMKLFLGNCQKIASHDAEVYFSSSHSIFHTFQKKSYRQLSLYAKSSRQTSTILSVLCKLFATSMNVSMSKQKTSWVTSKSESMSFEFESPPT